MLIFLDTEFTDFVQIDLISIALVTEDGREFYAERTDYSREDCSDFVRAAVLPNLGRFPGATCDRNELTHRLHAWFDSLPEPGVLTFDYIADWELLIDACLDVEHPCLPPNIGDKLHLGADVLGNSVYQHALNRTYTQTWPRHHALADARALSIGYWAWSGISLNDKLPPESAGSRNQRS